MELLSTSVTTTTRGNSQWGVEETRGERFSASLAGQNHKKNNNTREGVKWRENEEKYEGKKSIRKVKVER